MGASVGVAVEMIGTVHRLRSSSPTDFIARGIKKVLIFVGALRVSCLVHLLGLAGH